MIDHQLLRYGSTRLRIGPWRTDGALAHLVVYDTRPVGATAIDDALERLSADGYVAVITSALSPGAARPFLRAGFTVRQELALLSHRLRSLGTRPAGMFRRGRRTDQPGVLELDALAFTPFWRLDEVGLHDALTATPASRFRVHGDPVVGYAICGRAGADGYVQRIAVDPSAQRRGIGSALVVDGLHWMRRRAVSRAWVNTPVDNAAALALYDRLGFERQPDGLVVLSRALDTERRP